MAMAGMILGLGSSIAGGIMQIDASQKAARAQEKALQLQQQSEATREQASRLDAQRRKREMIREQIIARSQAQSTATNQNAQYGTALEGAYGQIGAQTSFNISGVEGQRLLAADIFGYNRQIGEARKEEARAGAQSALGAGISSIGGALGRSLGSIGRLG